MIVCALHEEIDTETNTEVHTLCQRGFQAQKEFQNTHGQQWFDALFAH